MRCKQFIVLFLAAPAMCVPGIDSGYVYAGDEVDYSAPYLTVENGELVTRYPAKEHAPGDAPVQADVDEVTEPPQKQPISLPVWGLLAAMAVALFMFLRYALSRRKGAV